MPTALCKPREFSKERFADLIEHLLDITENQRDLARQVGVGQATISLWNQKKIKKAPPTEVLIRIADLLGWSPEKLNQHIFLDGESRSTSQVALRAKPKKTTVREISTAIATLNDQEFDQFSRSLLEKLTFERISKLAAASVGELQKRHNNVVNPRTKNPNSVERQKLQQLVRQCLVKNNWKIEDFAEEADISLDTAKSIYYQGEIPSEIVGEDLILLMGDLASVLTDPKTGHHFRDDITLARYIGIEVIEEGDDEDEDDDFDDHLTNGNGNSNGHHLNGV
jgi:transcriptional regulator with XRE-family HTH domain